MKCLNKIIRSPLKKFLGEMEFYFCSQGLEKKTKKQTVGIQSYFWWFYF